jgi:hypothetical protein
MNAKFILNKLRDERKSTSMQAPNAKPSPSPLINDEKNTAQKTESLLAPVQRTVHINKCDFDISLEIVEDSSGELRSGNGATLWDSAIIMTKFLLAEKCLQGHRILELGAGVGLPSIALAISGNIVMATERPMMLPLLERSIDANRSAHPDMNICMRQLEWTESSTEILNLVEDFDMDVIIGSDLIFPNNESHWKALVTTISTLLNGSRKEDAMHGCSRIGYLSYEFRASNVISRFERLLRAEHILMCRVYTRGLEIPDDLHLYELTGCL